MVGMAQAAFVDKVKVDTWGTSSVEEVVVDIGMEKVLVLDMMVVVGKTLALAASQMEEADGAAEGFERVVGGKFGDLQLTFAEASLAEMGSFEQDSSFVEAASLEIAAPLEMQPWASMAGQPLATLEASEAGELLARLKVPLASMVMVAEAEAAYNPSVKVASLASPTTEVINMA